MMSEVTELGDGSRRPPATRARSPRTSPEVPASRARTSAKSAKAATPAARASAAAKRPASKKVSGVSVPVHPATLAIDIGGTGLKASVLGTDGRLLADRVRVPTPYPCPPRTMVDTLVALVAPLPTSDRCSVGFPGVVRDGLVRTAPHFITESGPGSAIVPTLQAEWASFDLAGSLADRLGVPVRVANDADLQGWAVVSGIGLEMVVTLGTGVGTALFQDGRLAPHLELAHHRFRAHETYNEQIGDAALRKIGPKRWRRRVLKAIANFESLVNYDHLYIGGGNARHLVGRLPESITIIDNVAGIVGGIKLWEHPVHH